jgi:hypothetical protein
MIWTTARSARLQPYTHDRGSIKQAVSEAPGIVEVQTVWCFQAAVDVLGWSKAE